jgi:nucleoside-diphosphate-sugar epimerase
LTRHLLRRGHNVLALARSDASAARLVELGAGVLLGNIETPAHWVSSLPDVDAVIHAACDFNSPMAEIDRRLLDALLSRLASQPAKPRFIYTGGCWLFGATGGAIATERTPFSPLAAFAWMVPHLRRVLESPAVDGIVIHPAMVYDANGGVFARFAREAVERAAIRVVGSETIRWSLVHREDLAALYALALERAPARSSYLGVATEGFPVGRIARAFARRFGTPNVEPEVIPADLIAAELGEWARGYALDQRMSDAKARSELGWTPKHSYPDEKDT